MEEEINLRELIEVLINGKWIIIGICFVAVLAAGVLSFFVLPEKYEARATIMFDNSFIGQQGLSLESYKELILSPARMEYVYNELQLGDKDYTMTSFKNSVKTEVNKEAGLVSITAAGTDPELVRQIVNLFGQISVNDFRQRLIYNKEREIIKAEKMLENINQEMANIPKLLGTTEVKERGGQVILIPEVNPMYEKLSARWDEVNSLVTQLKADKEYLEEGLKTGGKGLFIILQNAPLPEEPVSPRKMLNMAVAGVLGLMVSVFVVFFREFWRKSTPQFHTVDGSRM